MIAVTNNCSRGVATPTIAAEQEKAHRQREFAVDSGVSLDWTNERTEQFLQGHLNALREVAAVSV